MSRIGKKPVELPEAVKAELKGRRLKVTGPLGTIQFDCHSAIKVAVEAGSIVVENEHPADRVRRQLHGTTRTLIANMVKGVSEGFEKKLELYGTGFSVSEKAGKLVLQIGFCHPVERVVPEGIKVDVQTKVTKGNDIPAKFSISGVDKCLLGQFAAELRRIRPPEPYKGKGIRYADERVSRKAGKAFASGTA
jgi:large subunit ribosomal protein L6